MREDAGVFFEVPPNAVAAAVDEREHVFGDVACGGDAERVPFGGSTADASYGRLLWFLSRPLWVVRKESRVALLCTHNFTAEEGISLFI